MRGFALLCLLETPRVALAWIPPAAALPSARNSDVGLCWQNVKKYVFKRLEATLRPNYVALALCAWPTPPPNPFSVPINSLEVGPGAASRRRRVAKPSLKGWEVLKKKNVSF